jgi:hypothetical protein
LEADKYQPVLNPAFEMLAQHYGFVIECLPPAEPEKKGKVERLMPFVRRLFEAHGEWKGLEEAQTYLDRKVTLANERKHGTTGEQPIARFQAKEKDALHSLPPLRFERQEMSEPVVRADGYVRFKGKYYSVGEAHRSKSVVVLASSQLVRIYLEGRLLCVHERVVDPALSKSTKTEHLKEWEQSLADNKAYIEKARRIGPNTSLLVTTILASNHGFVETRMVWGLFHLATIYSHKDVDDACGIALEHCAYTYREVKRILENTSQPIKKGESRKHAFTRDMSEYTSHIKRKETKDECHHAAGATAASPPVHGSPGASHASREHEKEHTN